MSGTWKYDEPEVENVTLGCSPSVTFSADGRPISMSYEQLCVIFCHMANYNYQGETVNEYHLPSKNAHSPNYCSWLAVGVNYSANFFTKLH